VELFQAGTGPGTIILAGGVDATTESQDSVEGRAAVDCGHGGTAIAFGSGGGCHHSIQSMGKRSAEVEDANGDSERNHRHTERLDAEPDPLYDNRNVTFEELEQSQAIHPDLPPVMAAVLRQNGRFLPGDTSNRRLNPNRLRTSMFSEENCGESTIGGRVSQRWHDPELRTVVAPRRSEW
jgi:hypothetical protein